MRIPLLVWGIGWLLSQGVVAQPLAQKPPPLVLEDFEAYPVGGIPGRWMRTAGRKLAPITPDYMRPDEYFVIEREGARQYARVYTEDQAMLIILPREAGYTWNLKTHPRLRWDWRVHALPDGANERRERTNDSGAAVYVTFSFNLWGKPRSIKYVHSTTLPVGTTVSYGSLKIVVVASGEKGLGEWITMERDVVADYRRLFGKAPPEEALSVTLWSDSDTLNSQSEADFDNLVALPRQIVVRESETGPR